MWLVNLSNKDVECFYFMKIWYDAADKTQAMQYQWVISTCYAKDIHSGRMRETKWRVLERKEFLKDVRKEKRIEARMEKTTFLGSLKFMNKPIPTNQTLIPSEERIKKPYKNFIETGFQR
ncbi:hypothetical protein Hanom_Chr03g00207511 [Helianthus anomalus]